MRGRSKHTYDGHYAPATIPCLGKNHMQRGAYSTSAPPSLWPSAYMENPSKAFKLPEVIVAPGNVQQPV